MKEKSNNLNFFKKLYYSMFKINKYGELTKEGIKSSFTYVMDILIILSIIYASIMIMHTKKSVNSLKEYLTQNLPDMVCENNSLKTNTDDRIILNDNLVVSNFGGQIVIDTKTEYEELIEEYKKKKEPTILLTTNYFTTINQDGEVSKDEYNNILQKYLGNEVEKIDKEELLYLFDNFSFMYYFLAYMLSYAIAHSIMLFIYGIIISLIMLVFCKIKKASIVFKEIYCMALYSSTLTIFAYFIMSFMSSNLLRIIIQTIFTILPIIFLSAAVYINKWITPEMTGKKHK